ncbi:helix-turn-helix domain-containing protein [uncultured Tenacibaculum sp.]|uniref:helix-turn-helix domain-containing protein n=1 Tax=uncultured Tenacibaculum sp. TaxID=174713 RepID=UPI0026232905|nr:helix-turn-helix domain-containing protein [uncultured Tenacibaculum sp.]
MSKLLAYRKKFNLTQEELAEKSGISVRTIQRIEAGAPLKGHTLNAISKALNIDKENLNGQKNEESINIKLIKLINLSSLPFVAIPLVNILIPFAIVYYKKEYNRLTKEIISIQIFWTIISTILILLSPFANRLFSSEIRLTLPVMILLILINITIILVNTVGLDKHQKNYIKLKFNFL